MKSFAIASIVTLLSTATALAQEAAQPAPAAPAPAAATVTVSDQELAKFAAATKVVQTIMAEHQPKIAAAEGAEAQAEARGKMSADLGTGVGQHGFTVQRYNEIAVAARSDQALAARIAQAGRAAASANDSAAPTSGVSR